MDVTSLRVRLGRSRGLQEEPALSLLKSRASKAPARTTLGFFGSSETVVAVPPNGPAIFQSTAGAVAAQIVKPTASKAGMSGRKDKDRLIIFGRICFGSSESVAYFYC